MTDARILLTTLDNRERARELARKLVETRLAACVNLIEGVHSVYRWQGRVESADEVLLIVKTSLGRIPVLKETIAGLHSYELPEIVVLPVSDSSEQYLDWLLAATRGPVG